jgi:hypothetical protein
MESPEPAPEPAPTATVAESVSTAADPSTSSNGVQESDEVAPAAPAAPAVTTAVAEPEVGPAPQPAPELTPVEATVAEATVVPAHTHESVAEATTQVLVTGLTSFGAITSFKQSLERVDGVSRVSLGLGTSGEFIFTAVHRDPFDLEAAIRSFEESAQFVSSNGQLRVTVGTKA